MPLTLVAAFHTGASQHPEVFGFRKCRSAELTGMQDYDAARCLPICTLRPTTPCNRPQYSPPICSSVCPAREQKQEMYFIEALAAKIENAM